MKNLKRMTMFTLFALAVAAHADPGGKGGATLGKSIGKVPLPGKITTPGKGPAKTGSPAPVSADGSGAHGGNAEDAEFQDIARELVGLMKKSHLHTQLFDQEKFYEAVETTKVEATNGELPPLDGETKDALNYPEHHKIVVSMQRFPNLTMQLKQQLVIHEYLGIIGVHEQAYRISHQTLLFLQAKMGDGLTAPQTFRYDCKLDNNKQSVEGLFRHFRLTIEGRQAYLNDHKDNPGMVASYPDRFIEDLAAYTNLSAWYGDLGWNEYGLTILVFKGMIDGKDQEGKMWIRIASDGDDSPYGSAYTYSCRRMDGN